jgi:hypothetical protein
MIVTLCLTQHFLSLFIAATVAQAQANEQGEGYYLAELFYDCRFFVFFEKKECFGWLGFSAKRQIRQ